MPQRQANGKPARHPLAPARTGRHSEHRTGRRKRASRIATGIPKGLSKPLVRARRRGTSGGARGSTIAPSEAAAREDGQGGCRTARNDRQDAKTI